ncbi:hypothetical protein C8Q80DRAFT_1198467 [Daedaleopsis nitida]|nr:hypothetical protein C8Q80DRAFT_1198467 [Daedaleopsis nitida]
MSAGPSNQPAQKRNDPPTFRVIQHLLEDGTFVDIPKEVLRDPPPTPRETVYLQHYYYTPSGIKKELQECGSAEAAVDALANELEGMRHLLTGYVTNFDRYVAHFNAVHDEMRQDQKSRAESYGYMFKAVQMLFQDATGYRRRVDDLETNVAKMHNTYSRPPPRIIRSQRGPGSKNPELTAEDAHTAKTRHADRMFNMQREDHIAESGKILRDEARFAELLVPPTPQPPASADNDADKKKKKKKGKGAAKGKGKGKGKGKQRADPEPEARTSTPLDPRVAVKVEKLADGLVAMRSALQRVQDMEFQNLKHLRTLAAHEQRHCGENWEIHDIVESKAHRARKILEITGVHVTAYERWVAKCLEDQAAASPTEADAAPSQESESAQTSDASSGSRSSPGAATSTAATSSQSSHGDLPAGEDGEVYAVTVDLKCDKQFDELTREEAIELLKALPLRIHFTPCGAPVDVSNPPAANENEDADASGPLIAAAAATSASTAEHGEQQAIDVDEEMAEVQAQPQPKAKATTKTQSRKRGRTLDDTDANDDADLRSGGSPVKKKRV